MTSAELKNIVAKNIKYYRVMKNLTQSVLAEKAELSVGYICDLESGHKWGTPETLVNITNALEISPYQLFISSGDELNSDISDTVIRNLGNSLKKQIDDYIESAISKK